VIQALRYDKQHDPSQDKGHPLTTSEVYSVGTSIGTFDTMVLIFVRFVFGGFLVLKACCCTRKLEGGAATLEWEKIKNDNP